MNFASPFAYVPTAEDDEDVMELDDDDLEDGVLAENVDVLSTVLEGAGESASLTTHAVDEESKRESAAPSAGGGGFMGRLAAAFHRRAPAAAAAAPRAAAAGGAARPPRRATRKDRKRDKKKGARARYRQRIDTNVVSLTLANLAEEVPVATGDAEFCGKCKAVLSVMSTLYAHDGTILAGPGAPIAAGAGGGGAGSGAGAGATGERAAPLADAAAPLAPEMPRALTAASAREPEVKERRRTDARSASEPAEGDHESLSVPVAAAAAAPAPAVAPAATTTAAASAPSGAGGAGAGAATPAAAAPAPSTSSAAPDLTGVEEGDQLWVCEFCGHHNVVTLDNEEIPSNASMDYIVEAAPTSTSAASDDAGIVVFCVDVSGSMGDRTADMARTLGAGHGSQFMPGEQNITYVSRLQAVQAAVSSQIEALKAEFPKKKVALVTFSSAVTIIGDGTSDAVTLAGTRLDDFEQLVGAGRGVALDHAVEETAKGLVDKVYGLEEGGSTALGPAVLTSVAIAAGGRGSKVVVCTDGLANVGLGALDELKTDDERDAATAFYTRVGNLAVESGVVIDVIGIEGEGCDVETLGNMVELTSGDIEKVNPLQMHKQFGTAMANPILATHVGATILLHAGLAFRNVEGVTDNKLFKDVGNATVDTEITFEYRDKNRAELTAAGVDLATITQLPFQVQIQYTKLNGMKCIRVISQAKKVTHDRHIAEQAVDTSVISSHAAAQSAALATAGDYEASRANAMLWGRMMKRTAHTGEQRAAYTGWAQDATEMEMALRDQEETERSSGLSFAASSASDRLRVRRQARSGNDYLSSVIHKAKKGGRSKAKTRRMRKARAHK